VESVPKSVTTFRLALAACLLLPLMAHAAGLGRLTVQSALGQPLRAEVAIVSLQAGEADALSARIASPEAFRLAGIEFNSTLLNIRVAVERSDGRPVLQLTSSQPINEPFIELLLELQWASGRLVREYTFLLDPVEYKPPQPVAMAPPPTAPAAKPAPAAPAVEAKPLVSEPKGAGTYQVKRGDTLSKVARENKLDGVSVNQMLVALYQANKSAFMRNNMYLMRSGHILKIPDRAAAISINPVEATRMVRAQSVGFDEYRRSLGASVAAARAKPTPPPEREAPGRITPKPAEPAAKDTKDQIKLSKIDSAKPAAPASRAAAEDEKASLNRALKESQSRVADLEKQVTDLKKLMEMKNQQLALLEQKAAAKPAAEAPKPVPPAPKPAAEPVKPAAEAPKPAAEAPKADAAKPAAPAAAPKPVAAAPPPPSVVDEFLGNPLALGGLGGVVALLVGYGAWAWRRKKSAQAREGGFDAVAAASAASAAQAAVPRPATAPAEAAMVQAGAALGAGDEVDPIAEADVYIAYGRDAQAETILKDALASNPDRLVVHAKLLDIYAQRRDKASFEKTALKVKGLSGGSGPEWDKAMGLGRSIDPENGLYGMGAAAGAEAPAQPASASPTVDFDIGASAPDTPAQFKPGDTLVLTAAEMQAASSKMDFDIGATTQETLAAKPTPAAVAPEEAPSSLDFNLDFDLGETKPAPAAPDISSISLDLGAPGEAQPGATSKWQEVATKLDLAKAYEEMGDKDGARELLNEVLKEGDAAQREEAKRVLAKLG
jgi:pilus assembly protein FimV